MAVEIALTAVQIAALLGFSIGFLWGEAFSNFDGQVKYSSEWFQRLSPFQQWLVASALDAMHHFQYGLALILAVMVYGEALPVVLQTLLVYVGLGLIVSDWKDYEYVLKRFGLLSKSMEAKPG